MNNREILDRYEHFKGNPPDFYADEKEIKRCIDCSYNDVWFCRLHEKEITEETEPCEYWED